MAELLVIADDLTGALDAGVQLARKGDRVLVSLDRESSFDRAAEADVIVIDAESRHDSPDLAYQKVSRIVREGIRLGIRRVYKKTDSGLRGNVGSELAAVLDASGADHLDFVPAYPKLHRTTEGGVHFVDGLPLAQSVFASDPIDPVTVSRVDELIHMQGDVPVISWEQGAVLRGIVVYDCADDGELRAIAETIRAGSCDTPAAGCSGLLGMFPRQSPHDAPAGYPQMLLDARLIVVSGSANAVSAFQLDEAERAGALRRQLPLDTILSGGWLREQAERLVDEALEAGAGNPIILLDTLGERFDCASAGLIEHAAPLISQAAGLCAAVAAERSGRTTMIVGGDALASFASCVGATLLEPLDELSPGVVVARYEGPAAAGTVITKSGAFGTAGLFHDIQEVLARRQEGA